MKSKIKPKVLHIITRYIGGGAEENTKLTCLGLKKSYDITLAFGNEYDRENVQEIKKQGINIKKFKNLKHLNPFSSFLALIEIYRYIKKSRPEIVHTHSTEAGIIGRIAAKLAGTRTIIHTIHGTPFSDTRPRWINLLTLIGEKIAARCSTKIIANANALSREYLKRGIGKSNQYTTIYSGIDISRYNKAKPIKSIRNKSNFNIAMISRVTEGKGHKEAIEVLRRLQKKDKDTHLFIVGDGDEFNEYKKDAPKNISFLGYRKDIPQILASIDLLILPSYREGTPRCITEAMASGLPVIATNIAGIPEQIEDGKNGFLIPVKDINMLQKRIVEIKNSKKLRKDMGQNSRKKVKKFSKEKMVEDINALYKKYIY